MTVTTIPAHLSFIDILAQSLWRQGPSDLAEALILLPNRRACRSLKQALINQAGNQAFILPRMMPVADLDVEDIALTTQWIDKDILPPISPLERQGILMQLIVKYGQVIGEKGYGQAVHAAQLAKELARLIDQIHWEGLSFDQIHHLVPEDYAQHWQVTLDFLKIMTEYWPQILKDRQASDPAAWRRDLILSYAKKWQEQPPQTAVIVAGSTGSIPCTATLMDTVRQLPQGRVILPGLDNYLPDEDWQHLEITHPQYGMARLLERFTLSRSEVPHEFSLHISPAPAQARSQLLSKAMQPSVVSDWRLPAPLCEQALKGLHIYDVKNQNEEAGIIALLMRHALEETHKTIALVTPDRSLVERVKTELRRWQLLPDDTGGLSLSNSPEGIFLCLLSECLIQPESLLLFLNILNHPYIRHGGNEHLILHFDKYACRKHRTLPDALADPDMEPAVKDFIAKIYKALHSFHRLLDQPDIELVQALTLHHEIAVNLTNKKITQDTYAEDLHQFLKDLMTAASSFPKISLRDYPALFRQLLAPVTVRQPLGHHPRLFILGPLEARTIKTDLMILGGLNEGSWPPLTETDPWLNRPMRADYGLPLPERRIGLSAHDFVQAFCASEVVCIRSSRVNGTPSVPSRWLQRLLTVLKASGVEASNSAEPWLSWYHALDKPETTHPLSRPRPCPPLSMRPKRLSVTQIEMLMRDPYALYAKKILKLEPLEERERPLSPALKGILIHDILDRFVRAKKDNLEDLLSLAESIFLPYQYQPEVINFWWPRFQRIAEWYIEIEKIYGQERLQSVTEETGEMSLPTSTGPFILTAKADRIDLLKTGDINIIDYKTGLPPSQAEIERGLAPQLTLEAAIAQAGGFKQLGKRKVKSLQFWRLRGGDPAGEIRIITKELETLIEEALTGVSSLIETYANPKTPYFAQPSSKYGLRYNPYSHLIRAQEWLKEQPA